MRYLSLAASFTYWLLAGQVHGFSTINVPSRSTRPPITSLPIARPSESSADAPKDPKPLVYQQLKKQLASVASAVMFASTLLGPLPPANAIESQIIGQISGSGLVFKDTLEVERFEDPKIKGITLYITNFQRPITERLTSNFLQDPSYASVACVKSSPTVAVADNINMTPQGEEVFQESKSILFKTLRGKSFLVRMSYQMAQDLTFYD